MSQEVEVKIIDNSKEILAALGEQLDLALDEVGNAAEEHAKRRCPVDTSRLKLSITHDHDDTKVIIGTNVEYAKYVELDDTKKHGPGTGAHFLRDAAANHSKEYKEILKVFLND